MTEPTITLTRDEAITIALELNRLVVSLDRIGSTYWHNPEAATAAVSELVEFRLLAHARKVLHEAFDRSTPEDREALDRAAEGIRYWGANP